METRSFKEIPMKEVKVYSDRTEEDNRRYAYEKAIEAYWKHVDRYHTWMNYYAIFNGALFVGFCSLLTATTKIVKLDNASSMELSNDYTILLLLICLIGLISSLCWISSLKGHTIWTNNWMRIIENYEDMPVYKLIITDEIEFKLTDSSFENHPRKLKDDEYYKAFSTSKITTLFVTTISIGWISAIFYVLYIICHDTESCNHSSFIECLLIHVVIFLILILLGLFVFYILILINIKGLFDKYEKLFSSDVRQKIIVIKKTD